MRNKYGKFYLLVFLITGVFLNPGFVLAQGNEQAAQRAKDYFEAGREFIRQGNYTAADNEFKKAQQLLGTTAPLAAAKIKEPVAVKEVSKEKAKEPVKNEELIKNPVLYYAKQIKLQPKSADLYYNLACEYIKMSEFKLAEEEMKRAFQLNRRDKDVCYNLGVIYENYLGDKNSAIYYYGRYINLAPRADDAWRVRVWIKDLQRQIVNEK